MANFRPRQSGSRHCRHSLDILSDGSDNTGHGAAFLTVFRSISGAKIDCGVLGDSHCDTASSTQLNILGRYALSGLPSPLARLASDQRYKLAPIRAAFLPSLDIRAISGLAALLLSLSDAGTEKLVIVGPRGAGDLVDGVVDSVLGRRRGWPKVNVCEVPNSNDGQWWKVYEDEYLVAHARCCEGSKFRDESKRQQKSVVSSSLSQSNDIAGGSAKVSSDDSEERVSSESKTPSSSSPRHRSPGEHSSWQAHGSGETSSEEVNSSVIYIFTVSSLAYTVSSSNESSVKISFSTCSSSDSDTCVHSGMLHRKDNPFSFATFPPGFDLFSPHSVKWLFPLPADAVPTQKRIRNHQPPLRFILCINPHLQILDYNIEKGNGYMKVCCSSDITQLASHHFSTIPDILCPDSWDRGILVRSRRQIQRLRDAGLKCAFPVRIGQGSESTSHSSSHTKTRGKASQSNCVAFLPLPSSTSVSLDELVWPNGMLSSDGYQCVLPFDRRTLTQQRCTVEGKGDKDGGNANWDKYGGIANEAAHSNARKFADAVTLINCSYQRSPDEVSIREFSFEAHTHTQDGDGHCSGAVICAPENQLDENEIALDDDDIQEDDDCIDGVELREGVDNSQRGEKEKWDTAPAATASPKCAPPDNSARVDLLDPLKAHLLVLGTGCASPSPVRGSSGYALLFPSATVSSDRFSEMDEISQLRLALVGLIECGEGTLFSLGRYLSRPAGSLFKSKSDDLMSWLKDLKFIWISHSHLDHYSDLPLVVRAVNEAQKSRSVHFVSKNDQPMCRVCTSDLKPPSSRKRARPGFGPNPDPGQIDRNREPSQRPLLNRLPLVIIAPPKVLRFLNVSLQCQNGFRLKAKKHPSQTTTESLFGGDRLFYGIVHREFDSSCHPVVRQIRDDIFGMKLQFGAHGHRSSHGAHSSRPDFYQPIRCLRSIPVEHCPDAHALIIGLNIPQRKNAASYPTGKPFYLCFSGDARPSDSLVCACRNMKYQPISLLIHEATFDDDERGRTEALKKRHSTVSEAIDVGKRMGAKACLLSHFSGRYPRMPPSLACSPGSKTESKELKGFMSDKSAPVYSQREVVGCAVDGLIVPLTEAALSTLSLLDFCFAAVFADDNDTKTSNM